MQFTTAALALLATSVSAKTVTVHVGKGGLKFDPETIEAQKGDMLEFHFQSTHSVVEGDYKKGCSPVDKGGFFSGVMMGESKVFQVMVESTDPMFLYCSVGQHCQDGMVAVVNPSSEMTLDKYKDATANSKENMSPKAAFGGTVKDGSDKGGMSMSSGMMSSGMMSSGSMAKTDSMMMTQSSGSMMTMSGTEMPTGTDMSMSGTEMPTKTDAGMSSGAGASKPTTTNGASNAQVGLLAAAAGIAAFVV